LSSGWCVLTYTGQASSAYKEKNLKLKKSSLWKRKATQQKKEDFMLDKYPERDKSIT